MHIMTPVTALAYVNHGRWVADCPTQCGGAQSLEPRQGLFSCGVCHQFFDVSWPVDADEIWKALERRDAPKTRNWYPKGHPVALRGNLPHGQSIIELIDEQEENDPKDNYCDHDEYGSW